MAVQSASCSAKILHHVSFCTCFLELFFYFCAGNFTCLSAVFVLRRRIGYHLFHTYIPSGLIVVMSWISFWIKPEAIPARVTLGVTSLLTLGNSPSMTSQTAPAAHDCEPRLTFPSTDRQQHRAPSRSDPFRPCPTSKPSTCGCPRALCSCSSPYSSSPSSTTSWDQ